MLCNLSRVELKENWTIWDCITPGVARLIALNDAERLAVVRALGFCGVPVIDYFREAHGASGTDLNAVFRSVSERLKGPAGPQEMEHRFITEDVPFGLVFFRSVGDHAGVAMPVTKCLIELCSNLYGRDFEAEGNTLQALGLSGLTVEQLRATISGEAS